jgi:hypothetical protein
MDSINDKDDSLLEIHKQLKKQYYSNIKYLSILTGASVCLSLIMISSNDFKYAFKIPFVFFVLSLNIISIIWGIVFVIKIIDPNKYEKMAKNIYNEEVKKLSSNEETLDRGEFINDFIEIETQLRTLVLKNDFKLHYYINNKRQFLSFKELTEIIYRNEIITQQEYGLLLELSRIRNSVVHGHMEKINKEIWEPLIITL